MNIGFDLDRIFVRYPPAVPSLLIDWLYKSHGTSLSYRIPTHPLEIALRRFSHLPSFRRPILRNIRFVQHLAASGAHKLFLISSRYDFLEPQTKSLLARYGLDKLFTAVFLNLANEQAHTFKERILKQEDIALYVDDDCELIRYLTSRLPNTTCVCFDPGRSLEEQLGNL